jgi:outer membrane protein insertion porin family
VAAQQADKVSAIDVVGIQRIEADTVRSYLTIAPGDTFNAEALDKSLRNLFATGLFQDVKLEREGGRLVVRVQENPVINRIAFEGNNHIKDEQLTGEVTLKPRTVFTRTKVQNDVKRLLDVYRRSGRFAATVEPKIIQLEQNRIDLVFEINEGQTTYVQAINFVGNKQFSDGKLRELLRTKEERWYRFFSQDDSYDPDRLTFDRELVRRFYLSRGYADFRIDSITAELAPDRTGFIVTFTVNEGERYTFGDVQLTTRLPDLNPEELRPIVLARAGEWYNSEEVEESIQKLTEAVGNRGFAFVDVKPHLERKPDEKKINVSFAIDEGPRVFVDRIDITGNVRTVDKVVRREMKLVEGDAFNAAKLRRSQQRLRELNFFEKVNVTNVPSETAPDRTNIKVEVQEKSTGELSFGAGYSTTLGPLLEVSARERNLLGLGQNLKLSGMLAGSKSQADISFTEPYFLDRPIAAGFDLFAVRRDMSSYSSYNSETLGTSLRMGYQLSEKLREDWKYTLRQSRIYDVGDTATRYIKDQEGTTVLSSIGHTLMYDRRDSRLEPTEGWYVRFSQEFAGLGGDERFLRLNVGGGHYFNFGEQWVLQVQGTAGYIIGINDQVRINERYFLGGDNLRGFETAGIGARDSNGDALGGVWSWTGTVQLDFPLGLPQELGLTGHVFSDFGILGPTEELAGETISYDSSLRASLGVGMTWRSPFGPLSLDLGYPVLKASYDKTQYFRFNFGTRF